jgi:SAM-dependent methyltransferase
MLKQRQSLTRFVWETVNPEYVEIYETLETKYNHVYSSSTRRLAEFGHLSQGMTALDIGCGTGISTEVLLKVVGSSGKVVGVDTSPAMLESAKRKLANFPHVNLFQGDAYTVNEITDEMNLTGRIDFACSNFTYYYLTDRRRQLHKLVWDLLREDGCWAFNITSYLKQIEINGETYNKFSSIFLKELDSTLRLRGHPNGIGLPMMKKLPSIEQELQALRSVGFTQIVIEAFPLPLSPSQAYHFTLEGFYQYGSMPTFSKTLCEIPLSKRIPIIQDVIEITREEMDKSGENPTVINIIARK